MAVVISRTVSDGRVVVDVEEDSEGKMLPVGSGTNKQLKLKLENLLNIESQWLDETEPGRSGH